MSACRAPAGPVASPTSTGQTLVPAATATRAAEARDTSAAGAAAPGSPGLGDPIYPSLGNGGYDVLNYDLALDVSQDTRTVSGTVTLDAMASQGLSAFNLDLSGLAVDAVRVDGREAQFSRAGSELTVVPEQPLVRERRFAVEVDYGGNPEPIQDPGAPIPLGWIQQPGGSYVVSEPSGAMAWYPGNNHPSDKATYTFRITVPQPLEVAANGVLSETVAGDGVSTFVWRMDQPMASYLATVQVNDYDVVTDTTASGVVIRNYFPVGTSDAVRDRFAETPAMLEFVEELIAPYPFDAYGVVLLAEPAGWALETQSLSTYGMDGPSRPETVMHELVHSWFGNHVSPATWQDVWLNEGFASYFEALWNEHQGLVPVDEAMAQVLELIDGAEAGPPALPAQDELFSLSTYYRGAYALHALRQAVGDDVFFQILREYYSRHAGGSASTTDFTAVAEELGGTAAAEVLDQWLYAERVPRP